MVVKVISTFFFYWLWCFWFDCGWMPWVMNKWRWLWIMRNFPQFLLDLWSLPFFSLKIWVFSLQLENPVDSTKFLQIPLFFFLNRMNSLLVDHQVIPCPWLEKHSLCSSWYLNTNFNLTLNMIINSKSRHPFQKYKLILCGFFKIVRTLVLFHWLQWTSFFNWWRWFLFLFIQGFFNLSLFRFLDLFFETFSFPWSLWRFLFRDSMSCVYHDERSFLE